MADPAACQEDSVVNHSHLPPSSEEPASAQDSPEPDSAGEHGGHGGWGMAGMMLLCCIPMVVLIVLAVASSR